MNVASSALDLEWKNVQQLIHDGHVIWARNQPLLLEAIEILDHLLLQDYWPKVTRIEKEYNHSIFLNDKSHGQRSLGLQTMGVTKLDEV